MTAASTRPWYRLHWLTWLVVVLVVGALAIRECRSEVVFWISDAMYHAKRHGGWPLTHVVIDEVGHMTMAVGPPVRTYDWVFLSLACNIACCFLLVASTALVTDSWLRSSKRLQMSLGALLNIVFVTAVLVALLNGTGETHRNVHAWTGLLRPLRWPIVFALGCTIYTVGWLVWASSHRLLALLHRDR